MKVGAGSVWRNRDVGLVVAGTTVNNMGDWLLELALPLYVFSETGSGLSTAAVYLVGLVVSSLFGPLGGRLVDTWRLKPTLVTTNLLQIAALLPLLAVKPDRIWPLFVVVVLQGLIGAVNNPASFALIPRLVDDEQLVAANSALSGGLSVSRLVGAAAGGFAVEFGGMATVVAADAASFAVGALAAALLSAAADRRANGADAPEADDDKSVIAGLREVRRQPGLTAVMCIQVLAATVFGGFPVLFIVFITEYIDGSGSDVGIIRASSALGGLLAAAVVGAVSSKISPPHLMAYGFLLFGVVSTMFVNAPPFTTTLWVYILLFGATGFPNVASGVGIQSTIQLLTPAPVMGRVAGVRGSVFAMGMGLGSILAGVGLEFTTARVLLNVEAVMFLACGVIGLIFVVGRTGAQATDSLAA